MKVSVEDNYQITLEEVYNFVKLLQSNGDFVTIGMRDNGFELIYNGRLVELKDGRIITHNVPKIVTSEEETCSACGAGMRKWWMCNSTNPKCANKFKMKTYIGSKIVKGTPMTNHEFLNKIKNQDIPSGEEDQNGYLVEYPDGYQSWSPKETFETAYREVTAGEIDLLHPSSVDIESSQGESSAADHVAESYAQNQGDSDKPDFDESKDVDLSGEDDQQG